MAMTEESKWIEVARDAQNPAVICAQLNPIEVPSRAA